MKKWVIGLLVLVLLFLSATWFFIPSTLEISVSAKIACNGQGALRKLTNDSIFRRRLLETDSNNVSSDISKFITHGFEIVMQYKNKSYPGHLLLIPASTDSTVITCELTVRAGNNPFQKIAGYQDALALKKQAEKMVSGLQNNLSAFENVYGFSLNEASTPDSFFITTRTRSSFYPTTPFVYAQIHKLEKFCEQQGGIITNPPMLNISGTDSLGYIVKTALPVNKTMPPNGDITPGKMVRGRYIITDVTGGPQKIQTTMRNILYYFQDYARVAMAIPFEYLVTDREKQPDTSKWVTRIYSPVF